ncbi:MAG: BON domain-containing protein [Chloroflexi bacterium]|nr:BON domain-containing protein [Chloroflexota bacterium]
MSRKTHARFHNGRNPHVKGIRLSDESGELTHLILSGMFGEDRLLLSLQGVGEIVEDVIVITDDALEPDDLPSYRQDRAIESDGWEALYASEDISPTDLHGIVIAVVDGRVAVTGNVRERKAAEDVGASLRKVEGVLSVEDETFSDREIEMSLTVVLAKEHRDVSSRLLVHSQLGRIELSWPASADASMHATMQLVRSVPGVRAVENNLARANAFPVGPEQEASEAKP